MCHILLTETLLKCWEQFVKLSRLNNRPIAQASSGCLARHDYRILPGDDIELAAMQTRNEVGILLCCDDLLKFKRESGVNLCQKERHLTQDTHSRAISVLSESTTSLMMITKVDWKSAGFATGSSTVELFWNDWNSPVISRLRAKLLRKRT